jgi:DNA-binding CsgD family transcriptional regulator
MLAEDVIDSIYEAAVLPDRWGTLLDTIARSLGCRGGLIFSVRVGDPEWLASPGAHTMMEDAIAGGWMRQNDRFAPVVEASYPWFVTETYFQPEEELLNIPVYRDFLKPRGWDAAAGTVIQGAHDDLIALTFEAFGSHAAARAALPMLNTVRPHLARALSLTSQFHLAREQAIVSGLGAIDAAAAVVSSRGQLRSCNTAFERSAASLLCETSTRLRIEDARADALLVDALGRAGASAAASRSIVLRSPDGAPPIVLHILPLRHGAQDVFGSNGFLLLLATPDNAAAPRADLLRLLFDLTAREARLALALMYGGGLNEAAISMGVTYATARTHLKAIFAKTGVSRQAELVRLLASYTLPQPVVDKLPLTA